VVARVLRYRRDVDRIQRGTSVAAGYRLEVRNGPGPFSRLSLHRSERSQGVGHENLLCWTMSIVTLDQLLTEARVVSQHW